MLKSRSVHDEVHNLYRDSARRLLADKLAPVFDDWEREGMVPRDFWRAAGAAGLLCPHVPEEYGGAGTDYLFCSVALEEMSYATGGGGPASQMSAHGDICASYFLSLGTEAQKQRWLPGMVSGDAIAAIAMTEPGAGSDLQRITTRAVARDGIFEISGSKTYITNGISADIIIVACVTDPGAGSKGISLILVEGDRPGLRRGRKLEKMGHRSADTAELFFDGVTVPQDNLLGTLNTGFRHMMTELPRERLSVAVNGMAAAQRAYDLALDYARERTAFGRPVIAFQNSRYKMAEVATELAVGWAFLDQCLVEHVGGQLDTAKASMAKLWISELQGRVVDQCLQMFGGMGFMDECAISRMYRDARVQRIYGGTSEIMKELISRAL